MFGKIKLRRSDTLFSKYIRELRGNKCEKCGRKGEEWKLEASHFWGRVAESVRYDPDNIDCLCFLCHQEFHANRKDYEKWKLQKLGRKKYDLLEMRKYQYKKKDEKLAIMYVSELLKD